VVGRCVRLTTVPPSCAVIMKAGNLHFLEPSGSLQAYNGTALPFTERATDLFKLRIVVMTNSSKLFTDRQFVL
jgi:hypothetical protein